MSLAGAPARGGAPGKVAAFAELGKLRIVELWLGIPLAWTLLAPAQRAQAITGILLVLALLVEAGTTSSALALDDVAGYRDGVDAANHQDTDRYGVGKPLLDGRLTEWEALRFAWGAAGIAICALVAALLVARHVPWWELLLAGGTLVLALNYSFGARLSYVGACEAVTFLALTATVLFPYGLLTGTLTTRVTAQSILLGLWMLQIALFSNTQDAAGDREAGRLTLAARSAPAVNQRVIALVFAASWALTAVTLATGVLEWWTAPLLAPAWLLQGNADLAGMPTST